VRYCPGSIEAWEGLMKAAIHIRILHLESSPAMTNEAVEDLVRSGKLLDLEVISSLKRVDPLSSAKLSELD
jgi:hypothetical protein